MVPNLSISTHDALTTMDVPSKFDVTQWPRNVEKYLEQTEKPLHRAILKNYLRHLLLESRDTGTRSSFPNSPSTSPCTGSATAA